MLSCRWVCGAPHETAICCLRWHVRISAGSQETSREVSQGVGPGASGAVDGAAIDPRCHQVHLHVVV